MLYKELINNIETISLNHLLVESFEEGDNVYKVNSNDNLYPIVYLTPFTHKLGKISKYSFVMYYIDRLLDDKSNRLDIQSSGIKALYDIVNAIDLLDNTEHSGELKVTTFTEKFSDECAGAFIELTIDTLTLINDCNSMIEIPSDNLVITESNEPIITEDNKNIILE